MHVSFMTEAEARTLNQADPPVVHCDILVAAHATGDAGAEAQWDGATIEIFGGPDRTEPVAELVFAAEEVREAFGASGIAPGGDQEMAWYLAAPLPFHGRLVQRYTVDPAGELRSAEGSFECGPSLDSGAPPTVTIVEFSPASPEPGGQVVLRYSAASEVGLWTLRVELSTGEWSDQWSRYVEVGSMSRNDTVQSTLPWVLPTGGPLSVTVTATDLTGQYAEAAAQSAETVEDRSAPSLHVEPVCDSDCPVAAGGTVRLAGHIGDSSPHRLIYSLGDPAFLVDTVAFVPGGHDFAVEIPIDPPEMGRHPLHVRAIDSQERGGGDSVVAVLNVYPGAAMDLARVEITGLVTDVLIDEPRDVVYAARPTEGDILVLSLTDLTQLASIPLEGGPYGLDLTLSSDSLLVAISDRGVIAVLDANSYAPVGEFTLAALEPGFRPLSVKVARSGRWLIHAEHPVDGQPGFADVALLEYRPATDQHVVLESGRRDAWGRLIASDDRSRIATAAECLRVYDGDTGEPSACTQGSIREFATDGTGSMFADAGQLLNSDLQRVFMWYPLSGYATAVDLTPDGHHLLVALSDYLDVVPAIDDALPQLRLWGALPSGRLEVSASGAVAIAWGSLDLLPSFNQDSTPMARLSLTPLEILTP